MQPNYKNRKRRGIKIVDKKRFIMAILLSGSLVLSVPTVINGTKDIVDNIAYNFETNDYDDLLVTHRTNDNEHYFVKTDETAKRILERHFESRDDFYHCLVMLSKCFTGNKSDVIRGIVSELSFVSTDLEDSIFPTSAEFESFLEEYNLLDENNNIDFQRWQKYDKSMRELEKDLDELKGGKPL